MIKVASANFFVGNTQVAKDARFLVSNGIDIAGIQEGHSGNVQGIDKALGNKYKVILTGKSLERQDVPVVFNKKTLEYLKSWGRLISKRSQKENIGMPRSATVVRFKKDGQKYSFINTHTNAAVQSRATGRPLSTRIRRVAEFIAGMIVLEAMIRNAHRRGDKVILTGDLNYREVKTNVWKFSPQAMFNRLNMNYRVRGIDYIAVSDGLQLSKLNVINPSKTGSDHPWIVATVSYGARKKRRRSRRRRLDKR